MVVSYRTPCDTMLRIFLSETEAREELIRIGVHQAGIDIMVPKMSGMTLKLTAVAPQDAIIIKQEMLSIGGDAAISEKALPPTASSTDVLLMGSRKHMIILANKISQQYERLELIGKEIGNTISNLEKRTTLKIGSHLFHFGQRTYIMGILNVTPDSFYDGGCHFNHDDAVKHALKLEKQGADIIDIGGESSRPGAIPVSEKEELNRVIPLIKELSNKLHIPISVDTTKSKVAEKALSAGAHMVNDTTALRGDGMAKVVVEHDVPVCIMHMKGIPNTMQQNPYYGNVSEEVYRFLVERIQYAINKGVNSNKIIVDPGIGFGKRTGGDIDDNCYILGHLHELKGLGKPLLVGISQKLRNMCFINRKIL